MAGIKQFIEGILSHLSAIEVTNQDGNTVPLYTRVWNNQIDRERAGETYTYPKPAAFVEIESPMMFEEVGKNMRTATLSINIHLVHEYYNQDGTFEQDLTIFDLRDQVIASLSQFTSEGAGELVSNGETPDYDHDNLYHYIVSYFCEFTDTKGSPYDEGRGIYIEKDPPTDLELVIHKANSINPPLIQYYNILQPTDTFAAYYVADSDGVTEIFVTDTTGNTIAGCDIISVQVEIKILQPDQWSWNKPDGFLTLIGLSLGVGEQVIILYRKPLQ